MKYFLACVAAFAVVIATANYISPLFPEQPKTVAHFSSCLDYPAGSKARTACINEHFVEMNNYTTQAVNQTGINFLSTMDLESRRHNR